MPYTIMTACAKMPSSCRGRYRKVALVEIESGATPKMISNRAKGVVRIVRIWNKLHAGWSHGPNTAYARAMREAQALMQEMDR